MFHVRPRPLHVAPLGLGRLELGLSLVKVDRADNAVFQLRRDDAHLLGERGHRFLKDLFLGVERAEHVVVGGHVGGDREPDDAEVGGGGGGVRR